MERDEIHGTRFGLSNFVYDYQAVIRNIDNTPSASARSAIYDLAKLITDIEAIRGMGKVQIVQGYQCPELVKLYSYIPDYEAPEQGSLWDTTTGENCVILVPKIRASDVVMAIKNSINPRIYFHEMSVEGNIFSQAGALVRISKKSCLTDKCVNARLVWQKRAAGYPAVPYGDLN